MKLPSIKTLLLIPLVAFILFYVAAASFLATQDRPPLSAVAPPERPLEVAIFGASGTAGDGILKAALASNHISKIHIITRRVTPRIQAGINSGKVQMVIHKDYLDYSAVIGNLTEVDAVYWAIGISSLGVDEQTYGKIHVDFPMAFIQQWQKVANKKKPSFHFISSSDISEDSNTMWIREKIRAEKSLFGIAQHGPINVVAYRPDYIGPTQEQAHLGQTLLYWFFRPVGAAVKAQEIGRAMIDMTLRIPRPDNGSKLSTRKIILHSES